ncbi:MAG TPA: lysophospholipid acyltransferase family protein [Candidatus Binatia bacterium]|nr:lysophospholipid acyltransferase family protein [Candidatus Binatia bacterium]
MTGTTTGQGGRSLGRRLRARLLVAASWLACRLPERPLLAAADLAGELWYRLAPDRRRRARRNLRRIAKWLHEHQTGSPAARAAATDPKALTRLVREAFRFSARYYVQLARAPLVDRKFLDRWLVVDNRDEVDRILSQPGGKLFVGMHLGWFELPALLSAYRTGRPALVPSETLADPDLQAYMVRTRRRMGLELIELGGAKRLLREALERGETVGLLGDRDITGGGIDTELFGAPAPLAVGPALLALETGVTPQIFGAWRDDKGVFHGRAESVPLPAEGTRRERVTAWLAAAARVFERHIAAAPEQWLAVFHPIWPDLEGARARPVRSRAEAAG